MRGRQSPTLSYLIDVSTNPQNVHPSNQFKQSINPSIHPFMIQSITTHDTCPGTSTSFSRGCLSLSFFFSAPIYYFQVYCTSPGNRVSISQRSSCDKYNVSDFLLPCPYLRPSLLSSVTSTTGGGRNDEMTDMRHNHRRGDRY
jgi:hypothetical protein